MGERLRQVSSVLFDDYGDGTHAVEDYALAGKAADLIETQAREIERLRDTPHRIWAEARDSEWDEGFNYAVKLFRAALAGDNHDQ